jgi:multidrug resistance efflux pump
MKSSSRLRIHACTAGVAGGLALLLIAPGACAEAPVGTVESLALDLTLDARGRLEAGRTHPLRVAPRAHRGPLAVAEVVKPAGAVRAGEVVLRLESEDLRRALELAKTEQAEASQRLDTLREEHRQQVEAERLRLERVEKAAGRAAAAWTYHRETGEDRIARGEALKVQSTADTLRNQQQELEQLEAMYAETTLAEDTRDIVLDRARRTVARFEESLALARIDHAWYLNTGRADQKRDLEEAARWSAQELEQARRAARIEEAKRALALVEAERRRDDAVRKAEDLRLDLAAFDVAAPVDGVLAKIALRAGDAIQARQVLGDVHETASLAVPLQLGPQERTWLAASAEVQVEAPDAFGVTAPGVLVDILDLGTPEGSNVRFPARVALSNPDPALRVGMEVKVTAQHQTEPVLAAPVEAIRTEDDCTLVTLVTDDGDEPREVRVGRRSTTHVEILSGLTAGDRVRLPAPTEEAASSETEAPPAAGEPPPVGDAPPAEDPPAGEPCPDADAPGA